MVAPFARRPDTVEPGDLRGPYNGQVVDAASQSPVASALVEATWTYETLEPPHTPLFAVYRDTTTKADGSYELAQVAAPSLGAGGAGASTGERPMLRRFTLLVYKAGYLGYRSDLRMDGGVPRRDFAQRSARVRLERFPEGESHARHLAFLGGGAALRQAAQAELIQAAAELSEALRPAPKLQVEPPVEAPAAPDAAALLTLEDVRVVTGSKLPFVTDKLPAPAGLDAGEGTLYDGVHHRAKGRPESFDVALRVWRLATKDAEAGDALVTRLRPAKRPAGQLLTQHLQGEGLVVQLGCGASLCAKEAPAAALLKRALERLRPAEEKP